MAVLIQFRRDTAANWASVDPVLAAGELGFDTTNDAFKIGDGTSAWSALSFPVATATWGSITGTLSAQSDLQTALNGKQTLNSNLTTIAGLIATSDSFMQAKAGAWAARTITQVKADLGLTGTNSGDQTSIVGITGTKAQFDTAVSDGNFLYVGDVTSNATHTGDVTGSGALTIDPTAITGKSAATADGADYILISDTSDSGNLKKALVSDLAGGAGLGLVIAQKFALY